MVNDSWLGEFEKVEVDPGHLTSRLHALRDNQSVPLPNEGSARARRISGMEHELAEIGEFVSDCDRWADGIRDIRTNRNDVRIMMTGYLAKVRSKAVERGRQLHEELQYVKGLSK